MGFTWTTPIDVGDEIFELAMQEIRDNCDWLDDNISCLIHYATVYDPHYGSYLTTQYTDNRAAERSANYASNYSPHCAGQTGGACVVH